MAKSGRLIWRGDQISKDLWNHVRGNLMAAGIEGVNSIRGFMKQGGGKPGSGGTRGRIHSQPWTPPYVQTGHLWRSVASAVVDNALIVKIGVNIGREKVGYAAALEFGVPPHVRRIERKVKMKKGRKVKTSTYLHPGILPRPYIRPGVWAALPTIKQWLARPVPGWARR